LAFYVLRFAFLQGGLMHRLPARVLAGCLFILLASAMPAAAQPQAWTDWARVRNLEAGTEITVTTVLLARSDYRIAFADDSMLVLVRPLERVSVAVLDALRGVWLEWPAVLNGRPASVGTVRLSSQGIQENGVRVADVTTLPKSAVLEIRYRRGTDPAGVLLNVAGVGALAFAGDAHLREDFKLGAHRGVSPGSLPWPVYQGREFKYVLPGGLPLPVYFPDIVPQPRVDLRDVIYRAPTIRSTPLDDAAWRGLLKALPPSLQGRGRGRGGRP
jgi:hypothetical protein